MLNPSKNIYIIEKHIKTSRIVPNNSMLHQKYTVLGLEMQEIIDFLAFFTWINFFFKVYNLMASYFVIKYICTSVKLFEVSI
jgi:hypothetical protein